MGSAAAPRLTTHDKAYYADEKLVNFVRPGLVFKITGADIAGDGTVTARFKVTDPNGVGLDRLGMTTPGAISISFLIAAIPAGETQYRSYITRQRTDAASGRTATQATGENTGTFTMAGDGEYTYKFANKAPANIDRAATHVIGVYGSRNLTDFDMGTSRDDDVFLFVPNGSPVTATRDVVRTETCNKCHDPLSAHGGNRRSVELCVICHQPQTSDAVTGNTVDFKVMIHRIHTSKNLPSVVAGGKYRIGNTDFSDIGFPAYPDTRNCEVCHDQSSSAAQKTAYLKPSRAACGSCHDNVDFATGKNHIDQALTSDNQCATCHAPQGELEFDASVKGAHTIARFSRDLPGVVFEILDVTGATAGGKPTVTFSVKDKKGNPLDAAKMDQLRLYVNGPTTDYYGIPPAEDVRNASARGDGVYAWTLTNALPASAKGTFAAGIQGYKNVTLLPGKQKEQVARDIGLNKVKYFSVDGSPVVARRKVVDIAKCNVCHVSLQMHGGSRNQTEFCSLCHNPGGFTTGANQAGIALSQFIHRIHTGEDLSYDFIFGNTNFREEVKYPGDRRNCDKCHVNDSEQLPLPETNRDVQNPGGYVSPLGPATAACTGCHTAIQTTSHALGATTSLGESCSVCHGPSADFSVNRAHAR
ncbi:MAG: OmcA/MtrC family decaheme c-type cytochrome [Bryobacterales bacterium]|nr:OmcA/MtrC family decaheme c-type cytochrome [Bryobacterales bacterium]